MKRKDITGKKFGRLTAIKRKGVSCNKVSIWECKCECGLSKDVLLPLLLNGKTKSCGCYKSENITTRNITHGLSKTPMYRKYRLIKTRCYDKNNHAYKNYGGRGIKMCDEWKGYYISFLNWSKASGYKKGLSIERIDVNGDYEPQNCKWITMAEQARNKRTNRNFIIKGEKRCLKEWCEIYNMSYSLVQSRLKRGFSIEDALKNNIITALKDNLGEN